MRRRVGGETGATHTHGATAEMSSAATHTHGAATDMHGATATAAEVSATTATAAEVAAASSTAKMYHHRPRRTRHLSRQQPSPNTGKGLLRPRSSRFST